jgi:hypothetical protein
MRPWVWLGCPRGRCFVGDRASRGVSRLSGNARLRRHVSPPRYAWGAGPGGARGAGRGNGALKGTRHEPAVLRTSAHPTPRNTAWSVSRRRSRRPPLLTRVAPRVVFALGRHRPTLGPADRCRSPPSRPVLVRSSPDSSARSAADRPEVRAERPGAGAIRGDLAGDARGLCLA